MLGHILNLCWREILLLCLPSKYFYLNCQDNWISEYKAAISPSSMVTLLRKIPTSLPMGFQLYIREKQMFPDSCHTSQLYCARLDHNHSGCFDPIMYPFKNYYHCHASIIIWAKVLSNYSGLLVGLHI